MSILLLLHLIVIANVRFKKRDLIIQSCAVIVFANVGADKDLGEFPNPSESVEPQAGASLLLSIDRPMHFARVLVEGVSSSVCCTLKT